MESIEHLRAKLSAGLVIPASPLALNAERRLDCRRQRALFRYYFAAGAGGIAAGVHTTQFAIRDPGIGLYRPVLELGAEELARRQPRPVGIAGLSGSTAQAVAEATLARSLGYDAGLLSLGALAAATEEVLVAHCAAVAGIIPLIGFYLQPSAGGRPLSYSFWRRFSEIADVVAIKIAPFNRYQTIDVVRAVVEAGRDDIALYTGNDDNIVLDLLTPFRFRRGEKMIERRIAGGLLGQWAVWTKRAVELHTTCRSLAKSGEPIPAELLRTAVEVTDANAAIFDAANGFRGCIPGIHEILRRQGMLEGNWCLDLNERLSAGQLQEIDRVCSAYPHLQDDEFVREHLQKWLS